jgi:hypothetical protein
MRASLSGGSLSVEPGSRRADPAFEQSECFESDGREFAKEATGYALLGPKIVKLVVVRSDDVGFPSIQLQKGRQRCSEKWMAKPVCVTLGPLPTIQIAIS